MEKIPRPVANAVAKAANKHKNDINLAVDMAERNIRKLKSFDEYVTVLVRCALRDLIHDVRHSTNTQTKRERGAYGRPAKVVAGASESVARAAQSVYDYFIASRTLGSILGEELSGIADAEQAVGDGHIFNARLARILEPLVPTGKSVRESVSEPKLDKIFRKLNVE